MERIGQAAGIDRRRVRMGCRPLPQLRRGLGQRRDGLGIGRGDGQVERVDCRIEQQRGILDQRELLVLIGGHEAVDRNRFGNLGQRGESGCLRSCLVGIARQHVDRIRRAQRIAHQVDQRAHRRGVRVAQMERVEVEAHERQQGDAGQHRDAERPQHCLAAPREPMVDRRRAAESDFAPRYTGPEQHQQRREQGDAQDQRDHHAHAGDDAQFSDADIVGRQERTEAEEHRARSQRQRRRQRHRRPLQRRRDRRAVHPFGIEADADLDPEIDAEADEQGDERDRDQVECAHRQQAGGGGDDQPRNDRGDDCGDDPYRSRREPQGQQHRRGHHQPDKADILLERGELLVGKRYLTGSADTDAMRRIELQRRRLGRDRVDRRLARLQRVIIEPGLRQDQPAQRRSNAFAWFGEQPLPGEPALLPPRRAVECLTHRPHRPIDLAERSRSVLDPGRHGGQ